MSRAKQRTCQTNLYSYYAQYEKRIQTFKYWTGGANPRLLALVGFFSTDTDDHVCCFACGVRIKSWDKHCDPWTEHFKWKPSCRFLQTEHSEYKKQKTILKYSSFEERLKSYTISWPGTEFQDPVQMANAGFFYLGYGDHVQCFCCNIHLSSWDSQDIPIQEHARWNSRCGHLRERLQAESMRTQELILPKQKHLAQHFGETRMKEEKIKLVTVEDLEADSSGQEVVDIHDLGQGVSIRTGEFELKPTSCTSSSLEEPARGRTYDGKEYFSVSYQHYKR
ncbi:baculoviral IAP repeat-containing protein 7-A-like [Ostrea edulis]|uniref:baculoviral IAP repeat-containing protein 7-A-like n=1 Tax=Ostrea edulis TaxID=37623 RepID=UPI0024AFA91F|nr:baculoviral IAP repeat-containing protein 7-A-like [Ostrea edulis]XP_056014542.1 baculoviral IAP repeat-containing protein 7-A-like [Ostrea edulis]XP_056014543.1 baculoviral IAP repeat-containing protein 7-A-like [Ostrea edulis]